VIVVDQQNSPMSPSAAPWVRRAVVDSERLDIIDRASVDRASVDRASVDRASVDWAWWAERAAAIAPGVALDARSAEDTTAHPFAAVWTAWTRAGTEGLDRRRLTDAVDGERYQWGSTNHDLRASLVRLLQGRLEEAGRRALIDRCVAELGPGPSSDDARAWAHAHVADGFSRLFDTVPVWGRVMGIVVGQWIEVVGEMLHRLVDDRAVLHEHLAVQRDIDIVAVVGSGDRHLGGREVLVLHAADGTRIVYKPRPIDGEVLARQAAIHLRSNGGVDVDLVPLFVDRATYGWASFVPAAAPADEAAVERFLRRAGALVVLARTMGITDLHRENVVVAGDRPVAIDLECIAHAAIAHAAIVHDATAHASDAQGRPNSEGAAASLGQDPLLRTSLLPLASDPEGPDAHGLAVSPASLGPLPLAPLLEGMDHARRTIGATGLGIDIEAPAQRRVVVDHTALFEAILRRALRAEHLVDGTAFSTFIERSLSETGGALHTSTALGLAARRQIEQLDIPVVTALTTSLDGRSDGLAIRGLTSETGAALVARTAARLTEQAVGHFQADVVRISWDQRYGITDPGPPTHDPHAGAVDVASSLARYLTERAIRWHDGTLRWVTIDSGCDGLRPEIGDRGFYDGSAGIAMFLASTAAITGDEAAASIALQALAVGSDEPGRPDLESGRAGIGFARVAVGRLLGDEALVRRGVDDLTALDDAEHPESIELDWLAGRSGAVSALGAAAAAIGSERLASICEREARHLEMAWRSSLSVGGPRSIVALRLSAAHGIGGVLAAAGRAHGLRKDEALGVWASELVAHENRRIAARDGIASRRTRPHRTPEPGWCWGVSGHLVIRRALARWTALDDLDIHVSVGETIADGAMLPTSRLCCGTSAVVAALPPGSAAHSRAIRRLIGADGRLCNEVGASFPGTSLFRGVAGVGQILLRTVHPHLPDPLTLDLDARCEPPLRGHDAHRFDGHTTGNRPDHARLDHLTTDNHREHTP